MLPSSRAGAAARTPRAAALAVVTAAGLLAFTACTPSLTDQARADDGQARSDGASAEPYDSDVCDRVRAGIDAYNSGDLEASARAFDQALPLADARVRRLGDGDGSREARALQEAVAYYAGLGVDELREAFPASPETRQYQVTTLGQCQPLPPGLDDPEPEEQSA